MKGWCLEAWGDYACFTRPEMKVERVSYDVMTPSAGRAIFDAILWKPAISWHITKIEVLNPIKWISLRRNEVGRIASSPSQAQIDGKSKEAMALFIEENRQQRAGLFLRDVKYRIHGWFEFIPPEKRKARYYRYKEFWADMEEEAGLARTDETEAKYAAMFERRAKKGQCFHRPYLGCREFACYFRLVEEADLTPPIPITDDLGWMLYDMDYEDPVNLKPKFFRAHLENGVLNTDRRDPKLEVRS
jgi:CRISPR-associated protein Cas5d